MSALKVTCRRDVSPGSTVARGVFQDQVGDFDALQRSQFDIVGFSGRAGETCVSTVDGSPVILVGFGKQAGVTPSTIKRATAAAIRAASRTKVLSLVLPDGLGTGPDAGGLLSEMTTVAISVRYRFDAHRSVVSSDGPDELVIVCQSDSVALAAVERASIMQRGVALARDLVNEPGGSLTPVVFSGRCSELSGPQLDVVVHDRDAIRDLGMGGLLGVNKGSSEPPAFVEMHYSPAVDTGRKRVAFIGKGVTYDTGGIMLKQKASALLSMKTDMGGAAAIVGAMSILADLQVETPVSAYIPMTDNMTGGGAYRPGDVLRLYGGTTVEILDTDAEGRLVLGDALAYAREKSGAAAMLSIATLTGTVIHATGTEYAALIGRDQPIIDGLLEASARTNDRLWQLPRVAEYRGLLRSSIADMTNRSEAPAASSFAALFLESFVGDIPWAHVDMCGVVSRDRDTHEGPSGATGWGVELLAEYASRFGA